MERKLPFSSLNTNIIATHSCILPTHDDFLFQLTIYGFFSSFFSEIFLGITGIFSSLYKVPSPSHPLPPHNNSFFLPSALQLKVPSPQISQTQIMKKKTYDVSYKFTQNNYTNLPSSQKLLQSYDKHR